MKHISGNGGSGKLERRCLWIHQNFVTARQAGNSRPVQIIAAFLRDGWAVDVVAPMAGYLDDATKSAADETVDREGHLSIHRVNTSAGDSQLHNREGSYIRFAKKAFGKIFRIKEVDLIYCTSPPMPQILLSCFASVWRNASLLLEIRDLHPAYIVEIGKLRSRPLIWGFEWVESFAYYFADHCVVVNSSYVDYLRSMGVSAKRITVAPSGCDPYLAQECTQSVIRQELRDRWRAKYGLDDQCVMLLYIGSFNESYGIETLLEVASQLKQEGLSVFWMFAGNGRLRPEVEAAAAQGEHIQYLGSLARDDVICPLWAADIGIVTHGEYPLLETALSGKVFDYLATGLPIISVSEGITGSVVELANAGKVVPCGNADELAAAIRDLVAISDKGRRAMGLRGRAWAMKHLNAQTLAEQIVEQADTMVWDGWRIERLIRMARAAIRATLSLITRRSRRALSQLFGDETVRRRNINLSVEEWISRQPKSVRSGNNANDTAVHPLPGLLSGRNG